MDSWVGRLLKIFAIRGEGIVWSWAGVSVTTVVRPNPTDPWPQQTVKMNPTNSIGVAPPGLGIQPWFRPVFGPI